MAYPPNDDDLTDAKTTIVNILKMEGYKLDSGSLFLAFKDAGGEMSQFAPSLEELQEENIIKSDSEGNIMTVEDYQREKSQNNDDEDNVEEADKNEENTEQEINANGEVEEMLKKKEETDAWLIEKAKNGSKTDEKLRIELAEVKKRVEKLESILEKINEALK